MHYKGQCPENRTLGSAPIKRYQGRRVVPNPDPLFPIEQESGNPASQNCWAARFTQCSEYNVMIHTIESFRGNPVAVSWHGGRAHQGRTEWNYAACQRLHVWLKCLWWRRTDVDWSYLGWPSSSSRRCRTQNPCLLLVSERLVVDGIH